MPSDYLIDARIECNIDLRQIQLLIVLLEGLKSQDSVSKKYEEEISTYVFENDQTPKIAKYRTVYIRSGNGSSMNDQQKEESIDFIDTIKQSDVIIERKRTVIIEPSSRTYTSTQGQFSLLQCLGFVEDINKKVTRKYLGTMLINNVFLEEEMSQDESKTVKLILRIKTEPKNQQEAVQQLLYLKSYFSRCEVQAS